MLVDFIGTIHGQVNAIDLLDIHQRHTEGFRQSARLLTGRNPAHDQAFGNLLCEVFDKELCGRARPQAQRHSIFNKIHGRVSRVFFL